MKISPQQQEAIERLRREVKAGDTLYTKVTHVSRSGMSRSIEVFLIQDSKPWNISYLIARALEDSVNQKHGGIKVTGCGMDMGFQIVYNLSYFLFQKGFDCTGQKCPSNDHSNGDRNYQKHNHKDGGYALKQQWLS